MQASAVRLSSTSIGRSDVAPGSRALSHADKLMLTAAWALDRALRWLYAACAALAAVAIVVIAIAVLISIISRILGIYVPGTTEIAGYGMAAAGALGLGQTAFSHGHVRVDLVLSRFRTGPRNRVEVLATLISLAVIAFAAVFVMRLVRTSWRFGDLSSNSDNLPLWIPQLPMAIGFVVFALALAHMAVLGMIGRPLKDPLRQQAEEPK